MVSTVEASAVQPQVEEAVMVSTVEVVAQPEVVEAVQEVQPRVEGQKSKKVEAVPPEVVVES